MYQSDSCQRFLFEGLDIRGEIVRLCDSFGAILANKEYPGVVQGLLGEFLAAAALLSTTVKFDGRLVLQARSEGQVPLIMAECTSEQHLRGIARFADESISNEFTALLRAGTLAITIEPSSGEPYQGIVPLEQHSLAACLEEYFARSEQLESRIFLVSEGNRCAGLLVQQLPAQLLKDSESRQEEWNTVSQLAATLTGRELLELENEEVLYRLFHQHRVKLFGSKPVIYQCSCTRERTARALHSIGEEEIMDIIEEQGVVEVTCEFCGRQYSFSEGELGLLFENPVDKKTH